MCFFLLIVTKASSTVVFHQNFSISYDYLVKLACKALVNLLQSYHAAALHSPL